MNPGFGRDQKGSCQKKVIKRKVALVSILANYPPVPSTVYLYAEAARKESRSTLPAVRAGEFEALPDKVRIGQPIRPWQQSLNVLKSLIKEKKYSIFTTKVERRFLFLCLDIFYHHLPPTPSPSLWQLKCDEWAPDFGPALFVPSWGATVTGARKFLIAYNVNLISTKEQAHRIALDIREQGRGKDQVHAGSRNSQLVHRSLKDHC